MTILLDPECMGQQPRKDNEGDDSEDDSDGDDTDSGDAADHDGESSDSITPNYWSKRIPWYPDGCFGPYRSPSIGYSRRELLADAIVHVVSLVLGSLGIGFMLVSSQVHHTSLEVSISLWIYGVALLAMLSCSTVFNGLAWSRHLWALQLADHTGILLLIAGTYTPFTTMACCSHTLCFVWFLALASFAAKASRSRLDSVFFHVPCFLLMGWCILPVFSSLAMVFTLWARECAVLGGVLYTLGLLPWATNKLEFHNAIWHIFVLLASACFFVVVYCEISQPGHWLKVPNGTCQGDLFDARS